MVEPLTFDPLDGGLNCSEYKDMLAPLNAGLGEKQDVLSVEDGP